MPKKKRTAGNTSGDDAEQVAPKRTVVGPDHAFSLPTTQGKTLDMSYWDLWFALVAVKDFDGDLDQLAERIKQGTSFIYDRNAVERKRWHLRDLKLRLEEAKVTPVQVMCAAGDFAKTEKQRAIKKVMESGDRPSGWSELMRNTPRKRRYPQALHGYWDRFPASPQPYYETIGSHFLSMAFYPESMSFRIAQTLDRYAEKAAEFLEAGKAAQAQALLRAWLTVIVELMGKADGSSVWIGMSFKEGFTAYLKIPIDQTGIDEAVFFPDLLDFLIWEDYGLTNDRIEGYFKGITPAEADLCVEHLRREVAALREDDLEYQSEEALTLLGQVVAEQERFGEFEDLARQMGSREWLRIVRLVDGAMKRGKKPLAIQVFEAALTGGTHLSFLTKKFEKLRQGHWNPDPKK
jgi:hypothetical protein